MAIVWIVCWMSCLVVAATQQRCALDKNQPIDASVISFCANGAKNYSHIVMDSSNNQIIVAARSQISLLPYNLSSSQVKKVYENATTSQIAQCKLIHSKSACHNFFKVLLKDSSSGNIVACGTYANVPKCKFFNSKTLADATPSAWSSITDFDGYVPGIPDSSNTAVYVAGTGSLIAGSPRKPSAIAISRFTPGSSSSLVDIRTAIKGTDVERWLSSPDFVSSYEIGSFVYVFLRETALETDSKYHYSRVARICKDDPGDTVVLDSNWLTFVKSRISCDMPLTTPSYHFDRIISTAYVKQAKYNPDATSQDLFYAVFTGAIGSPTGSAVCAYGLSGTYANDLSRVYDGQYYFWDNGFKTETPTQFTCDSSNLRNIHDANKYQLTVSPVKQVTQFPLFNVNGLSATAITVDQVTADGQIYDILFLGFNDGKVRKISQVKSSSGSWEAKVLETVTVAVDEPILQLEILGNSDLSKRFLFAASSSKVSRIPLQRCDRYTTCSKCIAAQDPYCGWSSSQSSCIVSSAGLVVQSVTDGKYDSLCPKPPATFTLTMQSKLPNSVTVAWSAGSTPLQPYTKPSFWMYKGGQNIANVSNVTMTYMFSQLQPYTSYNFSLIPVNDFGIGTEAKLDNVITQAQAPEKVTITVSVRSSTETEIRWSEPRRTNGPLSKYEVFVSENGGTTSLLKTVADVTAFNYKERDTGLKPYTNNTYYVRACTDDGTTRCSNSNSVTVETFADFPSSPLSVTATSLSSTEIHVQWKPPAVSNGIVKAYRVIKQPHGEEVSSCCSGTQTSILVRGLQPYTDYTFKVAAATSRGFGSESDVASAKTAAGLPDPPEAPVLTASTGRMTPHIVVSWKKPDNLNGQLVKYGLCRNPGRCQNFNTSTLSFNDSNVQVCVTYVYTVSVLTNGGNSTSTTSQALVVGTPGAVNNLTSIALSPWEIGVSWQPPNNLKKCKIEFYNVLQNGATMCCSGNQMSYLASSLHPFTLYEFKVAAGTSVGSGPFTTKTETTHQSRPKSPRNLVVTYLSGQATLTWKEPSPNYGTPDQYHVYKNGVKVATVIPKQYDVPTIFADPGKSAEYTVTAQNSAGESPASSSKLVTRDEAPPDRCSGIYAMQSSETSILVSWLPPTVHNGVITGYRLIMVKPTRRDITTGTSLTYNETGLSLGTVYSFSISAYTSAGDGLAITSNEVILKKMTVTMPCATSPPSTVKAPLPTITTQAGHVPTAAPVPAAISARTVSSQEISLSWTLPSTTPESQVDRVVIKQTAVVLGQTREVCCSDVRRTYRTVSLQPYTLYRFDLYVVLKTGVEKNLNDQASARTSQAAPSAPRNVRATVTNSDSITLEWDVPNPPNGVISSYTVFRDGVDAGSVGGSTRIFAVDKLQPYMNYQFRVRASTSSNSLVGPFSTRHTFRTSEDIPGKMTEPRLAAVSTSVIYVTWDPPDEPNGQLLGYRVHRKLATGSQTDPCPKNQQASVTETDINDGTLLNERVSSLKVGTSYCFAVQARTSKGWGPNSGFMAVKTFDLAVVGENFSCPNVDFLNDYFRWANRLDRTVETTEPPTTNSIETIGFTVGAVLDNQQSEESPTVSIIVGVIAGLAVITTLVLAIMLFWMCRRSDFPVSDVGSPGRLNMEAGKNFGRPLPGGSAKTVDVNGHDPLYRNEDFSMRSVSQQMERAESFSQSPRMATPDVLDGTPRTGSRRPSTAWADGARSELQPPRRSAAPSGVYEPIEPRDDPRPPSTAPPEDVDETFESQNRVVSTIDYEDCELTDVTTS